MVNELKLENASWNDAWEFDNVKNWFVEDKITIFKNWDGLDAFRFSHPSYSEALKYLLTDHEFRTIFVKILLYTSKNWWAENALYALDVVENFNLLPEDERNRLLFMLPEDERNRLLFMLPEDERNRLLLLLPEDERNRLLLIRDSKKEKKKRKNAMTFFLHEVKKITNDAPTMEQIEKKIELDPNFYLGWYSKGAALVDLGKLEDAISCLNKAIEINPKRAASWYMKGIASSRMSKFDDALTCFNKVLEINPDSSNAYYNIACIKSLQNNKDEAIEFLKVAIKLDPQSLVWMRTDSDFDNIRGSKEFQNLLKEKN